jgi:hypothetical protein
VQQAIRGATLDDEILLDALPHYRANQTPGGEEARAAGGSERTA